MVGGITSPENDDVVQAVILPERANISTDVIEMRLLDVSGDEIASGRCLVGNNEIGVVDGRNRLCK